jgi:hypothetical protein
MRSPSAETDDSPAGFGRALEMENVIRVPRSGAHFTLIHFVMKSWAQSWTYSQELSEQIHPDVVAMRSARQTPHVNGWTRPHVWNRLRDATCRSENGARTVAIRFQQLRAGGGETTQSLQFCCATSELDVKTEGSNCRIAPPGRRRRCRLRDMLFTSGTPSAETLRRT